MMTRIVFMGSPDFAVPALRALASHYPISGVVTQPDRPAGRGRSVKAPAAKLAALALGLPVIQPERLTAPEAMQHLNGWTPDLIVVAAFGQILRPAVLALPTYGCLNVHASLLPRWRGAAPVQAAIAVGDAETGVTIMKMDEGLDTGGILAQQRIQIRPEDTAGSLTPRLAELGAELLIDTLPDYLAGKLEPTAQNSSLATKAPLLKKEDGLLDLAQPAPILERRVRAFNPWPGAYFMFEGQRLKVHQAHVEKGTEVAGARLVYQGLPALGTGSGLLVLDEIQPPGKKAMSGRAFLAGTRTWAK